MYYLIKTDEEISMSLKKADTVRLIYGIFLSIFTVAVGFLFLYQVVDIYGSGPQKPFTREIVSEHLSKISIPCIAWIVAVIGGVVLWWALPEQKKKAPSPAYVKTYNLLSKRIPDYADKCEREYELVQRRKTGLLTARIICAIIAVAAVIACGAYLFALSNFASINEQAFEHGLTGAFARLFNVKNFDADPTRGVITMTAKLLPWIGTSLACFIGLSVYEWATAKKVLPAVKKLVAEGAKQRLTPEVKAKPQKDRRVLTLVVRISLLCVAVALIVLGSINGGAYDVFIKAINICTECIGLG